jgi:hypothetical protein
MAFQNKVLLRIFKLRGKEIIKEKIAYGILHIIKSRGMILSRTRYKHKKKRNAYTLSMEGFTVRGHLGEQGVEDRKISAYRPVTYGSVLNRIAH